MTGLEWQRAFLIPVSCVQLVKILFFVFLGGHRITRGKDTWVEYTGGGCSVP